MKRVLLGIALTVSSIAMATTYTWNGGSGDWNDSANWTTEEIGASYPREATDTAVIGDGANITISSPVTVGGLNLSGTVTISGAELTFAGVPSANYVSAVGGTYTYNCSVMFSLTAYDGAMVPMAGVTHFDGGFYYDSDRLRLGKDCEVHFGAAVTMQKLTFGDSGSKVYFEATGNKMQCIWTAYNCMNEVHVLVDNPWDKFKSWTNNFQFDPSSRIYLHGHQVTTYGGAKFGSGNDCWLANRGMVYAADNEPSELRILNNPYGADNLSEPNQYLDFVGPVSIRLATDSTADYELNRSLSMTGEVIVEAQTFIFGANAAIPNASALRIASGAKVSVAAGNTVVVPELYLDGATTPVANGTYGATGSGADHIDDVHFAGTGKVSVYKIETRTQVKDGNLTDPTVWEPAGVPNDGDSLIIANRTLNLDKPIAVADLTLSGQVVMKGSPLTLTGGPASHYRSEIGGTYIYSNQLVFATVEIAAIPMKGVTYFCGGFDSSACERILLGADCEVHFREVPAVMQKLIFHDPRSQVHFEVAGNRLNRLETSVNCKNEVHVWVDDPWQAYTTIDYFYFDASSRLYLNGHRVTMTDQLRLGSVACTAGNKGFIHTPDDQPAELVLVNSRSTSEANKYLDIVGPVTIRLAEGTLYPYTLDRSLSTTGELRIDAGTFVLGANGAIPKVSAVRIASGAKLELAGAKQYNLNDLYLDGSETAEPKTSYGATGSGAKMVDDRHFSGSGFVRVGAFDPPTTRTQVQDGDLTDPTVWEPAGEPNDGDSLVVADHYLYLDRPISVAALTLRGEVYIAGNQLTLTTDYVANYVSDPDGTYVFSNKVVFAAGGTDTSELRGTTYFRGGFDSSAFDRVVLGPNCEVHFCDTPAKMKKLILNGENCNLYFEVASNAIQRLQTLINAQNQINVLVDDPWTWMPTPQAAYDYFLLDATTHLNLNGHRVRIYGDTQLGMQSDYWTARCSSIQTPADQPAELTLEVTKVQVKANEHLDVTGPVTVRMDSASTQEHRVGRSISSTGALIVEGGVYHLLANGAWPNTKSVTVSGAGKLVVDNPEAFSSQTVLAVDSAENLGITGEITVTVKRLILDGEVLPAGEYYFQYGETEGGFVRSLLGPALGGTIFTVE